jgi:hypothetical protein
MKLRVRLTSNWHPPQVPSCYQGLDHHATSPEGLTLANQAPVVLVVVVVVKSISKKKINFSVIICMPP